jgi:hypothetical protein
LMSPSISSSPMSLPSWASSAPTPISTLAGRPHPSLWFSNYSLHPKL